MDLLQAKGSYPPPPGASEILGVEGTVTCVQAEGKLDVLTYCTTISNSSFVIWLYGVLHIRIVSGTVADLAQGVPAAAELGKGDSVMVLMDGGGYAGGQRGYAVAFPIWGEGQYDLRPL